MAERDIFSFDIKANSTQAKKSFEELRDIAREVSKASENLVGGNAKPGDNSQFSNLVKQMTEAQAKYSEVKSAFKDGIELKLDVVYDKRSTEKDITSARKEAQELQKELDKVQKGFMAVRNKGIRSFKANEMETGRKARFSTNFANYQDEPSNLQSSYNTVKGITKSTKSDSRQALRIGRSAMNSKYINNSNASNYRDIYDNLTSKKTQGVSLERIVEANAKGEHISPNEVDRDSQRGNLMQHRESARSSQRDLLGAKEIAKQDYLEKREGDGQKYGSKMAPLKDNIQSLQEKNEEVGLDPGEMRELSKATHELESITREFAEAQEAARDTFDITMDSLNDEFKTTEKIIKQVAEALTALDEAAVTLSSQRTKIGESDVIEKPDRNTWRGRLFERSAALGLAVVGSATYAVGSQMKQGRATVDGMREDSLNIGYQTGDSDFRGIRQDYMEMGAPQGWKGQDMLGFSESILSNLGYMGQENLTGNMDNIASFSKFSGAGQETSTALMENLYSTGGVSTAEVARSIQEGVIGGIKASGMEGREKEQVDALNAIYGNLGKGRTMSEEEISNRLAMANVLSGEGRAFQGDNLAGFMMSGDSAVQNADPFSAMGMLLGMGSNPEFSGSGGLYEFAKMQEEGLTAENFNSIQQGLGKWVGDNPKDQAFELKQLNPGWEIGIEDLKNLLEKHADGLPIDAESAKILEDAQGKGSAALDQNEEAYMGSSDQDRQASEAYAEKMQSLLDENKLVDELVKLQEAFHKWGSQSALNAGASTVGIGTATGLGSMIGGIASMIVGPAISGLFGNGTFTGGPEAAKGIMDTLKNVGGKGGLLKGATALGGKTMTALGNGSSEGWGKLAASGTTGKGASMLGKAALPLAIANGIYQTATADDKVKEGGKQVGGIGGMVGGAKIGAAIGTAIAPGIGTAIGSFIGGTAGYIAGSGIGEGIVNTGRSLFGSEKVEASTLDQEEKATVNQKDRVESIRDDNITEEARNLEKQESIIDNMRELLRISAKQNGIIGEVMGNSYSQAYSGANGGKVTGSGEYWSSSNLLEHDLGSTSDQLTAEALNNWINGNAKEGSVMRNQGQAFMDAGASSGLDPRYLVAHAAHETDWGSSKIAKEKGNMYGIGAFDASPYASAYGYDSAEAGIVEGANWIKKNYYDKGNTDLNSMQAAGYATDTGWGTKIGNTMKGAEKHTQASSVNVNTTVNYDGSGNTTADANKIANGIASNISRVFRQERIRT